MHEATQIHPDEARHFPSAGNACAARLEPASGPDDTPAAALPPGTTVSGRIGTYSGSGGHALRYRLVEAPQPRARLVYLHGIESHGTWFLPAAGSLRLAGGTTWLLDRRGSGLNRAIGPGDAPGAAALIEDVHRFRLSLGEGPVHLAALSWGGKLALAAALQHPEDWRSITLITPGLVARVNLPARHVGAVLLSMIAGGGGRVPVPIQPEMFTAAEPSLRFIRGDPWRLDRITARFCWATRALDRRIARRSARLAAPVLLMLAERDRIVDNDRVAALVRRLRPDAAVTTFAGAEHAIQLDQTEEMVDRMVRFIAPASHKRVRA